MLCLFFVGEAGTDRNFGFSMALFPLLRPLLFSVYVIFSSFRVPHSLFSRIRTDVGASFPRLPLCIFAIRDGGPSVALHVVPPFDGSSAPVGASF